ncbi:hypothetical protein FFLO_01057 [Filobasidium floriforme]|uniref:Uncharacterized protein n=1 Tax=Filobasidium floriforme TaxID=5210 RepID=A0A8K0JV86_9TREE|nr:hypothetical protein FFLO_01057 [Filobasidium floriforme]
MNGQQFQTPDGPAPYESYSYQGYDQTAYHPQEQTIQMNERQEYPPPTLPYPSQSGNSSNPSAPAYSDPSPQLYTDYAYDQEKQKQQKVPFRRQRISKKCWWCIGIAGVIVLAAVIAIAVALGLRENNDEWKKNNP